MQVIAELVDVRMRRDAVAYLETLWKAEPTAMVDATLNPLARVHSGSRHLAIRFARLVVDGRVHHIIVSIERISAPRIVPHTIEVPVLNEDTFAKRLAGETGTRPALTPETIAALRQRCHRNRRRRAAAPPVEPGARPRPTSRRRGCDAPRVGAGRQRQGATRRRSMRPPTPSASVTAGSRHSIAAIRSADRKEHHRRSLRAVAAARSRSAATARDAVHRDRQPGEAGVTTTAAAETLAPPVRAP